VVAEGSNIFGEHCLCKLSRLMIKILPVITLPPEGIQMKWLPLWLAKPVTQDVEIILKMLKADKKIGHKSTRCGVTQNCNLWSRKVPKVVAQLRRLP
jgi:hypothetical protein